MKALAVQGLINLSPTVSRKQVEPEIHTTFIHIPKFDSDSFVDSSVSIALAISKPIDSLVKWFEDLT